MFTAVVSLHFFTVAMSPEISGIFIKHATNDHRKVSSPSVFLANFVRFNWPGELCHLLHLRDFSAESSLLESRLLYLPSVLVCGLYVDLPNFLDFYGLIID